MSHETRSDHQLLCPWCSRGNDASEIVKDVDRMDCGWCGKEFSVEVYHKTTYTCRPAGDRGPQNPPPGPPEAA